jgi:zinc D-Ala-D-Ala dipeptidase
VVSILLTALFMNAKPTEPCVRMQARVATVRGATGSKANPRLRRTWLFAGVALLAAVGCATAETASPVVGGESALSVWSGTGTCPLASVDAVVCAKAPVNVFDAAGKSIGTANPGDVVCKSDKVTASKSRWVYFPTPPAGSAFIPNAESSLCAFNKLNYGAPELRLFSYGVVDVETLVPRGDIRVTMAYATPFNFLKKDLYLGIQKCFLRPQVALKVAKASALLKAKGYRLVMLDCTRPYEVQEQLFAGAGGNENFAARPGQSKHNYGAAVDVTLEPLAGPAASAEAVINGQSRDLMGTVFDDFEHPEQIVTEPSFGITGAQAGRRKILVDAMAAAGMKNYANEWWHYDGLENYKDFPVVRIK